MDYAQLRTLLAPLITGLKDAGCSMLSSRDFAVPNLPALLPEVWLHWDPRTVKERGCSRQRRRTALRADGQGRPRTQVRGL